MKIRNVRQQHGEAGNALVEFAVSMVVILTLLFGIIDVGRALYAYDWVSNAARLGTRFAMVRGSSCSQLLGGCPAIQSDVVAYLNNNAQESTRTRLKCIPTVLWAKTLSQFCPALPGRRSMSKCNIPFHSFPLWLPTPGL